MVSENNGYLKYLTANTIYFKRVRENLLQLLFGLYTLDFTAILSLNMSSIDKSRINAYSNCILIMHTIYRFLDIGCVL